MTAPFDLSGYGAAVFDLDGTVWLGTTPIPGAAEFLDRCRGLGLRIAFATNAIVHSPASLSEQLVACGIARPDEPVVTSGSVMLHTLLRRGTTRVAAVLPAQLTEALTAAGIEVVSPNDTDPDDFGEPAADRALVMASSRLATIGEIERLGRLAVAGHPIFLSSREPGFPVPGGIEPGGGVLFGALRVMYDVDATVVGKPSAHYADAIAAAVDGRTGPIVMIGDSQRADVGTAAILECDSVLLTGHSVRPIDPKLALPTYTAPTLADAPVAHPRGD